MSTVLSRHYLVCASIFRLQKALAAGRECLHLLLQHRHFGEALKVQSKKLHLSIKSLSDECLDEFLPGARAARDAIARGAKREGFCFVFWIFFECKIRLALLLELLNQMFGVFRNVLNCFWSVEAQGT